MWNGWAYVHNPSILETGMGESEVWDETQLYEILFQNKQVKQADRRQEMAKEMVEDLISMRGI